MPCYLPGLPGMQRTHNMLLRLPLCGTPSTSHLPRLWSALDGPGTIWSTVLMIRKVRGYHGSRAGKTPVQGLGTVDRSTLDTGLTGAPWGHPMSAKMQRASKHAYAALPSQTQPVHDEVPQSADGQSPSPTSRPLLTLKMLWHMFTLCCPSGCYSLQDPTAGPPASTSYKLPCCPPGNFSLQAPLLMPPPCQLQHVHRSNMHLCTPLLRFRLQVLHPVAQPLPSLCLDHHCCSASRASIFPLTPTSSCGNSQNNKW